MKEVRKKPPSCIGEDDLDHDIAHFESLSEHDLDVHLATEGIATEETVKTVQKLVQAKLDEWRDRGLLHAEAIVVIGIAVTAKQRLIRRSSQRGKCGAATGFRDRNHSLYAAS